MFIDTHCHLFKEYYNNLDEIINEMKNNIMITSGCDVLSNKEVLETINKYPNVYGTIGMHPEYADNVKEEDYEFVINNLSNPKIVGIGEIGLDYHYTKENKEKQKEVFVKQLEIARKYNKTVVIHSRDAASDTLEILKKYQDLKIVLHCYGYNLDMAQEFIKLGVKFGIGGVLTFKNGIKLKEVVKNISISNLLLETDSPYMSPEPFRGKQNKPYNCYYVALKVAEIKNLELADVLKITTDNAINQFDLKL